MSLRQKPRQNYLSVEAFHLMFQRYQGSVRRHPDPRQQLQGLVIPPEHLIPYWQGFHLLNMRSSQN